MSCGILSLPLLLHRGPVSVCVLKAALWFYHLTAGSGGRPDTPRTPQREQISNLFSFIGLPAFSCSRRKSPLNLSVVSPGMNNSQCNQKCYQNLLFTWIHCILVSCQAFTSSICETVPSFIGGRSSRDFSGVPTGDTVNLLMSPGWFRAGRPKLFPPVTFLRVRFHLLFLLAYVCFVGVLLRVKWLKIHKWREIIQTTCDLKPPFQLQIEN